MSGGSAQRANTAKAMAAVATEAAAVAEACVEAAMVVHMAATDNSVTEFFYIQMPFTIHPNAIMYFKTLKKQINSSNSSSSIFFPPLTLRNVIPPHT